MSEMARVDHSNAVVAFTMLVTDLEIPVKTDKWIRTMV